jgi:surface protein
MFFSSNFNEIIGLKYFITSNVTDLDYIFNLCYYISNINDVENWNVSNVKYMWQTFGGGYNDTDTLINLDLSNWNTYNVEDMHEMFDGRKNLSSLKLFKNTTNVKDMSAMFQNCSSLTELDLTGWDTYNVENMSSMFNGCEALSNIINIENFKTNSCKDMHAMFKGCKNIKSFNLQNNGFIWNTTSVTDMSQMFYVCESLNNINISGWNTASVTDMANMFSRCRALTDGKISHILSNIEFDKATNISYMFEDCDDVKNIIYDFKGINEDLVDASGLFIKDGTIENNLSLNTNIEDIIENAEYIHNMFSGINKLNINNSNFITYDMSNIKSLGNLFYKTTINLPICFSGNFNMVLGSDEMIKNADKQIDTSVNGIFGNCTHIGNINNLSTFDISFGTYYDNNEYYSDNLFNSSTSSIFYQKQYLHYFIPTYKDDDLYTTTVNYDYFYGSKRHLGGLTNIFNNDINTSILLGDCFNTNLDNSFFKIYGDKNVKDKLLICNSKNMATNIKNNYSSLQVLYKCIVVNLTLDIPSEYESINVINEIFTNLLNNPSYMYFDNMIFSPGRSYSTTGRHIITAVFTSTDPENVTNHNIFKTGFTDNNKICDCITHIVISNSVKNVDTSLPVEFNNLEEVTIYFLPINGFEVDYDPGIIKSLEGNSKNININLIYDIENENIIIPTKPKKATYNIKCNPNNDDTKISGYNCYKYIIGDLRDY